MTWWSEIGCWPSASTNSKHSLRRRTSDSTLWQSNFDHWRTGCETYRSGYLQAAVVSSQTECGVQIVTVGRSLDEYVLNPVQNAPRNCGPCLDLVFVGGVRVRHGWV